MTILRSTPPQSPNTRKLSSGIQPNEMRKLPFGLSNLLLAAYTFSVVVLSKASQNLADVSQLIGFGLAFSFALEFVSMRRQEVFFPPGFLSLAVFLWWAMAGVFFAENVALVLTSTLTLIQLLMFSLIAYNIMINRGSISSFSIGFILGLLWSTYSLIVDSGLGLGIFVPGAFGTDRIGAALTNPNVYAIFLLIAIMLIFNLYQQFKAPKYRLVLITIAALFLYQVVFFTGSVKGILGIPIGFISYIVLKQMIGVNTNPNRILFALIMIISFLLIGIWVLDQSPHAYRLNLEESENVAARSNMIEFGINKWIENPIIGYGAGHFRTLYYGGSYSHNNYVELLVNFGLIGTMIYYSYFLFLLRQYLNGFISADEEEASNFAWAVTFVILLLFWDISSVSYYEKHTWLSFSVLTAFLYQKTRPKPVD